MLRNFHFQRLDTSLNDGALFQFFISDSTTGVFRPAPGTSVSQFQTSLSSISISPFDLRTMSGCIGELGEGMISAEKGEEEEAADISIN